MNIKKYRTIIFDCDGVILNSNKVKTKILKINYLCQILLKLIIQIKLLL